MKSKLLFVFWLLGVLTLTRTPHALADEPDKCGYDAALSKQMLLDLGPHWGYGYDSLLVDLQRWRQSPYVTIDSLGASVQNRALWQLTITSDQPVGDTLRHTVFIHARTHPGEVQAWWVTNEIINYLLSEEPFAVLLREKCTFYIVPMYNPDGVELEYPRENAHGVDLESNWSANPVEPEVAVLRGRFSELMMSAAPIEVALNMHSSVRCTRYFVYHDEAGTSHQYTQLEQQFINGVRFYFPGGIAPWNYFVSWKNGTPDYYPESWFWLNFREAVMALTYEDMNCSSAGKYDSTAFALLHGIADYLDVVTTILVDRQPREEGFVLQQNYPNPVYLSSSTAQRTVIQYSLERSGAVRLVLYDVLGRRVATLDEGYRQAGEHRVFSNLARLAEGIYFYRLETPWRAQSKRLLIFH